MKIPLLLITFYSPFKSVKWKFYLGKAQIGLPYYLPRRWNKDGKAIYKKVSVDFRDIWWKTKFTSTNYRFEYSPRFSVVFFGYQFAILFIAPEEDHYWEIFLFWNYETKGTWKERIEQCKKEFPQKWSRYSGDKKETVDMYDVVLKKKYL